MKLAFLILVTAAPVFCQRPVAPTDEPVGSQRGTDHDGYNIENSVETGYRLRLIDGNLGKYRSDVNYGNGFRLLSASLAIRSKEGRGRYFDELTFNTLGLGNDPYESASVRVQKNRVYRYELLWRLNEYYNPALTVAFGEHLVDTARRMQDHDLVLLSDSAFRIFLGYSRNIQTGPALTTIQLFDSRGDEFPLFANIRRERNEYRLGNEFRIAGFKLNWMRSWVNFKEDTPTNLPDPSAGNNPSDRTTLDAFQRIEPYHGNSPFWRVALLKENDPRYAVNGRFTYTAGQRGFVVDETALGTSRFGAPFNRQILTYGNARRPVATGNLNVSIFPGSRVSITNQTAVYNVRTEGDSFYRSVDNSSFQSTLINFQYLGIRTFSNQTDLNVDLHRSAGFFAGYAYSNREIRSIQSVDVAETSERQIATQTNRLNSGTLGLRWRPMKPLLLLINGEIGRSDRPIFPASERNYHAVGARLQYQARTLRFAAYARTNYNTNSVSLTSFSSRARNYAGEVSWIPSARLSIDASYSKLHLDTAGGIAFFANAELIRGTSFYLSNIHHGSITAHTALSSRIDLLAGYSRVQDAGDGTRPAPGTGVGVVAAAFQAVQTFPLVYESPFARISIRLHEKLRWNAGYQHYHYREDFAQSQNYRATTGYVSLLWSF